MGLKKYFVWHKGAPVPAAARGPQQPCYCHCLLKSPWLGARAPTLHKSEAEGSLMYHCNNNYLLLLNLERRGVLKSHLSPPPLRVVPATSIVHRSPALLGLLSAPFSVSIRWLLSGPRHVVSTRTQISPRRAWGAWCTFRSCTAPSRARTHTHAGAHAC